jgi:hypothetical protein
VKVLAWGWAERFTPGLGLETLKPFRLREGILEGGDNNGPMGSENSEN